jgi:hypothetical protein
MIQKYAPFVVCIIKNIMVTTFYVAFNNVEDQRSCEGSGTKAEFSGEGATIKKHLAALELAFKRNALSVRYEALATPVISHMSKGQTVDINVL